MSDIIRTGEENLEEGQTTMEE